MQICEAVEISGNSESHQHCNNEFVGVTFFGDYKWTVFLLLW